MKIITEEIEQVINHLAEALTYAKEARRVSKKVYGSETQISMEMKHVYRKIEEAKTVLEMQG